VARQEVGAAPTSASDESLMADIARADNAALSQLYDRYSSAVYGLALRMLASETAAEEIVQETFWRVWRRSATFDAGRGQLITWLLGIAHNLCIDELRRRRSRVVPFTGQAQEELLDALPASGPPVEEEIWLRERRRLIQDALTQLPLEQRRTVELAYFKGLSQREIAEATNEPLGTIKTRVRLGLRKLKELLARIEHE
jgi:RNA polymerase sigma-70 factor, ECF subfamily